MKNKSMFAMLWEIIRGRTSIDDIRKWNERRRKEKEKKLREKLARLEEREAEREFTFDVMRLEFSVRPVEMYIMCTLVMWGFLALDYVTIRTILDAFFMFLAKLGKIMGA